MMMIILYLVIKTTTLMEAITVITIIFVVIKI